jgi:hypothetical protein
MSRHRARAEFRRRERGAPWVIAGVWVDGLVFVPAAPGVEPVRWRLPEAGLVGWADLPPIVAVDQARAAEAALESARGIWPERDRGEVPHPFRPARTRRGGH